MNYLLLQEKQNYEFISLYNIYLIFLWSSQDINF